MAIRRISKALTELDKLSNQIEGLIGDINLVVGEVAPNGRTAEDMRIQGKVVSSHIRKLAYGLQKVLTQEVIKTLPEDEDERGRGFNSTPNRSADEDSIKEEEEEK